MDRITFRVSLERFLQHSKCFGEVIYSEDISNNTSIDVVPYSLEVTKKRVYSAPIEFFEPSSFQTKEKRDDSASITRSERCNRYQYIGQVYDIDKNDNNPIHAREYVTELYYHLRRKENITSTRPFYMEYQPNINEKMRSILVDWLLQIHLRFGFVPETLYLTVNLLDRYLERNKATRQDLQLVGVACLMIASKYEEIHPPKLCDFEFICDWAYNRNQIIEMEDNILTSIDYRVTIPTAHNFLLRCLKAGQANLKIVQISYYILDGTLQSYSLLQYLPSQLAAAAVFIARRTVGRDSWSPTLLKYAAHCEEEVIPVARAILAEKSSRSSSPSPKLFAVDKKYLYSRFGGVANIVFQSDF